MDARWLDEIADRAIEAGLAAPDKRRLLLAGLPRTLIAGIDTASSPAAQLRQDLQAIATQGTGAHDPLAQWLSNAGRDLAPRIEAAFFESALGRLAPGSRTEPMGVVPLHPLRFEPAADAFVAEHPDRDLFERCLTGLEWPLRARLWRARVGEAPHLTIVSVLASHAGRRISIHVGADRKLVIDAPDMAGQLAFERPTDARERIRDYFARGSETWS